MSGQAKEEGLEREDVEEDDLRAIRRRGRRARSTTRTTSRAPRGGCKSSQALRACRASELLAQGEPGGEQGRTVRGRVGEGHPGDPAVVELQGPKVDAGDPRDRRVAGGEEEDERRRAEGEDPSAIRKVADVGREGAVLLRVAARWARQLSSIIIERVRGGRTSRSVPECRSRRKGRTSWRRRKARRGGRAAAAALGPSSTRSILISRGPGERRERSRRRVERASSA